MSVMVGSRKKVIIVGALGMDFHTFNMVFRDNGEYEVVAFTFAEEQNVGTTELEERRYPAELAGKLYPDGIPMVPEAKLENIISENKVEEVVFAYSDVSHEEVMHKASRALAAGANYRLISPKFTQDKASVPVIAVCAVRTGCGKSQLSQFIADYLKKQGHRVVSIREPMPYGDLVKSEVMRFATEDDLVKHNCTVEEREEYESYINQGLVIYSGVDYVKIRREAEKEADVIVWDGGNNEVSFYVPDLLFVVADPLRPGSELKYHPGETNCRSADVFVINKCNSVEDGKVIDKLQQTLHELNPFAAVIKTNSVVSLNTPCDEEKIRGKKVVVVEDGPTCTHGSMAFGAGVVAAKKFGAAEIVTPQLRGGLVKAFQEFPQLTNIVPAMAYSEQQLLDLMQTLNETDADVVVNGSPINLGKLIKCNKPIVGVSYKIAPVNVGKDEITAKLQQFESKSNVLSAASKGPLMCPTSPKSA